VDSNRRRGKEMLMIKVSGIVEVENSDKEIARAIRSVRRIIREVKDLECLAKLVKGEETRVGEILNKLCLGLGIEVMEESESEKDGCKCINCRRGSAMVTMLENGLTILKEMEKELMGNIKDEQSILSVTEDEVEAMLKNLCGCVSRERSEAETQELDKNEGTTRELEVVISFESLEEREIEEAIEDVENMRLDKNLATTRDLTSKYALAS
jgi:hypothetical protein